VLETADPFPNRTNVQLLQVLDNHTIQIEIWERGAGYTLASGTSASASAGAAIQSGRCQSPVEVHMAGGKAHVIVDEQWQVKLTGQVEAVYRGMFP
jgi:diaminopimelate epimerase